MPDVGLSEKRGGGEGGEEKGEQEGGEGGTFYSLREWVLWLLFSAIEHEKDAINLQLLLHGVFVSMQDTGTCSTHS